MNMKPPAVADTLHPFHPQLDHAFTISLKLTKSKWLKPSTMGAERVAIYVESGEVAGPLLKGKVIPMSGGDWALFRPDGVIDFDARYMLELDDGTLVYLQNRGYRWASPEAMARQMRNEPVPFSEYYMRVSPKFDVPQGPHDWLAKHVFVGVAEKVPNGNSIHYFVVR